MPPAALHQVLLLTLAFLAAAAVAIRLRLGTGRTVIPHRGRVWPVVAASAATAVALSFTLHPASPAVGVIANIAFAVSLGALVHLSVRWDSFLSLFAQAGASWAAFAAWMLASDAIHAASTHGAFWQTWNSSINGIQVAAAVLVAVLQAAAIRGARSRARRPASVAVAQGERLGALRGVQAR